MMKFKNYMMGIATVTLLASMASCQKNDEVGNPATEIEAQEPATKGSYLSININLPTVAGQTRANDDFYDGDVNEYAVENAYLVIFAGTPNETNSNEDAMTLRSAYELNPTGFKKDTNDQITTSKIVTARVLTENILESENAYAFVILNKHEFFNVKKSTTAGYTNLTSLFDAADNDLMKMTFGDFKALLLDEHNKNFSNQSFTMTNMPHIHNPGGAASPYVSSSPAPWTLMQINKNKIFDNESSASTDPAVVLDVERVVAKVTVNQLIPDGKKATGWADDNKVYYTEKDIKDASSNPVAFKLLGWFIDNTNPNAFVTRNTAEPGKTAPWEYLSYASSQAPSTLSTKYRMASATPIHTEIANPSLSTYRTYWGVDPNYNAAATDLVSEAGKIVDNGIMNFNSSGTLVSGRLREVGSHYYCAENTFDVEHQTVRNTTRVVVAAQFNGGNSFFTIEAYTGKIYTAALVADQVKDLLAARVNVSNWISEYVNFDDITGSPEAIKTATEARKRSLFNVQVTGNGKGSANEGTATITLQLADDATLTAVLKGGKNLSDMKSGWTAIAANQNDYIAENITPIVSYYETGVAYYQALIKHFGDTETPWTGNPQMTNTTASIYSSNNATDYLGRYGVLRNNWYDITIDGIKDLGSPVVPELTDDPDDTVETYLSVKINIMPWAKRTQNVTL